VKKNPTGSFFGWFGYPGKSIPRGKSELSEKRGGGGGKRRDLGEAKKGRHERQGFEITKGEKKEI